MEIMEIGGAEMVLKLKTEYASLFVNEDLKLAVCIADEEYIPIESFKALFIEVSKLLSETDIVNFVFDKSKLRTFHQPSMEWYFAIWKPNMREKGLVNHYKILPKLEWFVKAVEAGKWEIFQKYGKDIVKGIDIYYVDSISQVVDKIQSS